MEVASITSAEKQGNCRLYQSALESLNDVTVYIDKQNLSLQTDRQKFADFFGCGINPKFFSEGNLFEKEIILLEDREPFKKLVSSALKGGYKTTEFRIKANTPCGYFWVSVTLLSSPDLNESLLCFKNIASEKNLSHELREAVKRDASTNLYNKKTCETLIRKKLKSGEKGAVFVMDIDDFKTVNDTAGHLLGDAVIIEIAQRLKNTLSADDCIIGRIGGDEFLAFLPCNEEAQAQKKAEELVLTASRPHYALGGELNATVSVGWAFSPQDGTDYETLFSCADLACYHCKNEGKNRCTKYNRSMSWNNIVMKDRQKSGNMPFIGNFIEYLYELMNRDSKPSIDFALSMTAKRFQAAQAFIALENGESDPLAGYYAEDSSLPELKSILGVLAESSTFKTGCDVEFASGYKNMREELKPSMRANSFQSYLYCAVKRGGKSVGLVGFHRKNLWNKDDLSTLNFAGKLIGLFAEKKIAADKAETLNLRLELILNTLSAQICTLNPNSHKIRYENGAFKKLRDGGGFPLACGGSGCCTNSEWSDCPLTKLLISGAPSLETQYGNFYILKSREKEVLFVKNL